MSVKISCDEEKVLAKKALNQPNVETKRRREDNG